MKLVTIDAPGSGRIGALVGDDVLDLQAASRLEPLAAWLPATTTALIATGEDGLAVVRRQLDRLAQASPAETSALRDEGLLTPLAQTRLRAPVQPGFIFCMGRSYTTHRREMMGEERATADRAAPTGFIQSIHSVTGPNSPIRIPASAPTMVDFEGEIAIVFNRPCHGVSAREAMDYVFGFTVVNDVSARDWIKDGNELNRMGKQFPTFLPMGPCVATIDTFDDPQDLHFVTRLNGEIMQDARTTDLVWSMPELIQYFSRWYTFEAGDILSTGTAGGVGYARDPKQFLKPGDRVSVAVDGIGMIENPVVA